MIETVLATYRKDLPPEKQKILAEQLSDKIALTAQEVGLLFGTSPYTVKNWIRTGKLQAYIEKGKYMIPLSVALGVQPPKAGRPRVLTSAAASKIKHSSARTTDLARFYDISPALVTRIRKGERYQDVE